MPQAPPLQHIMEQQAALAEQRLDEARQLHTSALQQLRQAEIAHDQAQQQAQTAYQNSQQATAAKKQPAATANKTLLSQQAKEAKTTHDTAQQKLRTAGQALIAAQTATEHAEKVLETATLAAREASQAARAPDERQAARAITARAFALALDQYSPMQSPQLSPAPDEAFSDSELSFPDSLTEDQDEGEHSSAPLQGPQQPIVTPMRLRSRRGSSHDT